MSEVFSNFFVATSFPLAQVIKFKLKTNWHLVPNEFSHGSGSLLIFSLSSQPLKAIIYSSFGLLRRVKPI